MKNKLFSGYIPDVPIGSLWQVVKNPYDDVERVCLNFNTTTPAHRFLETGEIVIVTRFIGKKLPSRRLQVITHTGPGWIHIDWWRETDGQPTMLVKISDPLSQNISTHQTT